MPDPAGVYMMRFTGHDSYQGYDPALDRYIAVKHGELLTVSPAKRDQLMADFPGDFDDYGVSEPTIVTDDATNVVRVDMPDPRPARTKPRSPRKTKGA